MATFTVTFHPVSIEALNASGGQISVTNPNNCIGDTYGATKSGNYAQYYLVTGSQAETFGWVQFDCSSIPANATITSVTGKFKIYSSGSATYISPRQLRLYYNNRTTAKGFSVNQVTSTTVTDLDCGTGWTRAMLEDLELRIYSKRTTKSVTSNYYVRIYGVDITVTYEVPDETGLYFKKNGNWVSVFKVFHKENGSWVEKDLDYLSNLNIHYVKNNGEIINARLPAEYQEVEYIGITNAGPYINTGIDPGNLEVVSTFQLTATPSSNSFGLDAAGSYNILSGKEFDPIFLITTNGTSFEWKDSSGNTVVTKNVDLQKHDIIYNNSNHQIIFDNQIIATNANLPCTDLSNTSMYIFGTNYTITSTWASNWRLYYCKITNNNNNTVLREFIPCYRKSDNAIGMYDIANYKFYANAGSDSFIKGTDV